MRAFLCIAILCLAAACAPAPSPTPSATPSPQPIQASPTPTTAPSTTATAETPAGGLAILGPGPDSRVLSPIEIQASVGTAGSLVRIELTGRDGRLLARNELRPTGTQITEAIPFEVRAAEDARLTLSVEDEYGRVAQALSVTLRLLPAGAEAEIEAASGDVALVIESPQAGDEIAGGELTVRGLVRGASSRPLTIQVISRAGRVLAVADVYPGDAGSDGYRPFSETFQIDASEESWVLVAVSRNGGDPPGLWYLESVEVLLLP